MSRPARNKRLLLNASAAFVAAIEVYNKPSFSYREETFAVLMLAAWELLLKAKILADAKDRESSLFVFERRKLKTGAQSKKKFIKRNRAQNPMTIGIVPSLGRLKSQGQITQEVELNLTSLMEVRDNAVHYLNASASLSQVVYELGSAAVHNFLGAAHNWFEHTPADRDFFLLPMAFSPPQKGLHIAPVSQGERHLLGYLKGIMQTEMVTSDADPSPYQIALNVSIDFTQSKAADSIPVIYAKEHDAVKVQMTETDWRKKYKWTSEKLREKLKGRYTDFKFNKRFNDLMKSVKADEELTWIRSLDPDNPSAAKKTFYNPSCLAFFDQHYQKVNEHSILYPATPIVKHQS